MNLFLEKLLKTDGGWSSLILRGVLGAVIFPHGAQKLLGWFGGYGFSGTVQAFTENMGMPYLIALLVIAGEFFASLALLAGLVTRLAAAGVMTILLGAVTMVHWQNGLFMNWFGNQAGEGFEYHLLAIAMAMALILSGGGRASLDGALHRRLSAG